MSGAVEHIDLYYPGTGVEGEVSEIHVGLVHTRAANDLIIRYDFERDGYAILMQPTREADGMAEEIGEPREVAFVEAWLEPES